MPPRQDEEEEPAEEPDLKAGIRPAGREQPCFFRSFAFEKLPFIKRRTLGTEYKTNGRWVGCWVVSRGVGGWAGGGWPGPPSTPAQTAAKHANVSTHHRLALETEQEAENPDRESQALGMKAATARASEVTQTVGCRPWQPSRETPASNAALISSLVQRRAPPLRHVGERRDAPATCTNGAGFAGEAGGERLSGPLRSHSEGRAHRRQQQQQVDAHPSSIICERRKQVPRPRKPRARRQT